MKANELRICGLPSVRARFRRNPDSIVRLFFDHETSQKVGLMCRALAARRRVYRCVEAAELERIADTVHHGGIVAVVEEGPRHSPAPSEIAGWARRRENAVVLDRIGNAHNLGAIARSAAYFGVPRLVLSGDAASARPGTSAYRVAEGGLEALEVSTVDDMVPFLGLLASAGYEVLGAATRGGTPANRGRTGAGPWALVLGNEETGLAPAVSAACVRLITIPGSGRVESLNVSAAAAVLIHELAGRKGSRPTARV
ncbi:MAG TPA: RNA methyltransferase [Opitutaceae bacterium]|jgi:TrmH RNA methyltransferase